MEQRLLYVGGELEHSATDFRQLPRGVWETNGVLAQSALDVTPRGAGANMTVDVSAGRAHISGYLAWSSATISKPIDPAPPSGQERIDSVQARVNEATGTWSVFVAKGTNASTGTASAPSVPSFALELAWVRVSAGTASIQAANITDRRVPAASVPIWAGDLPANTPGGTMVARPSGARAAIKGATRTVELWTGPSTFNQGNGNEQLVSTGNNTQIHNIDLDNTRHWTVFASWSMEVYRAFSGTSLVDARLQGVSDLSTQVTRESRGLSEFRVGHPTAHLSGSFTWNADPAINLTRVRVLLDVSNNSTYIRNSYLTVMAWPR
jgi:hypothetical protein